MTQTITVDGVSRGAAIRRETCEWVESAYAGEVGGGHFTIDDAAGNLNAVGHKSIAVDQSSSTPTAIFHGFVHKKNKHRGQYEVGAGREIDVATKDLNDLLQRRKITGTDGNRGTTGTETVGAQLTWLLASNYMSLVSDYGAVTYSTQPIQKSDLRGLFPSDIIGACAKKLNFNFYVRWNPTHSAAELVFRDDNTSTADTSTVTITNDGTANSTSSFAPFEDADLDEDPEHVYSAVYASFDTGAEYVTRASTAAAFVVRDGSTDDSGNRSSSMAIKEANLFLDQSATEEHLLTLKIRMRAAYVGLVQAGQRISVKMTHLATEGYGSATYFRILRKRVTQPLNTDADYDVALDLSPQETILSSACPYDNTPNGTYYPLGGPRPDGAGFSEGNVSDGVVYYLRAGIAFPDYPTVGAQSFWHYPTWGSSVGGNGTMDFFASGYQNELRFVVVGNGTLTIKTEQWLSEGQPYTITVTRMVGGNAVGVGSLQTGTAGGSTAVVIDTAAAPDCVHGIHVRCDARLDGSYIGMGWSSAVWVGA